MRLVVARHAEAAYVEDWFSDEGGSLTPEGRDAARALGASLAPTGVVAVVTSDTSRAVQTGEIAAAQLSDVSGVGVTAYKALREVFLGDLVGTPFHVERIEAVTQRWYAGDLDARFAGGESGAEVVQRHRATFAEVAGRHPDATVLVVGHQTALGIAVPGLATGVTPAWAQGHPLGNAESLELDQDAAGWVVRRWGAARS